MLADFKDEKTWSMCLDEWRILKGWIRLGHDVHRLSYRNLLMQTSPFPSKRIALKFAKKKTKWQEIKNNRRIFSLLSLKICGNLKMVDFIFD